MPRTEEQYQKMREESRKRILDAAFTVFAREGYHASTIGSISKEACISQGLMYNYFKSKEELLHEMMIGMFIPLMKELLPVKQGEKITRKDIINFINKSVDFVLEKPDFWRLYAGIFIQQEVMELLMGKLMELVQPFFEAFYKYYEDKGVENPQLKLKYFSAVLDGVQLHCMIDPKTFPAEEIKKLLIKQFT